MSSTLLFCDHTCHGLRTLCDCCHVGAIAVMLLEICFVRRAHCWYSPTRAVHCVLRGGCRVVERTIFRVLLEPVLWLVAATSDSSRSRSCFSDCQVCL